jgi:hypothetical protein
VTFLDAFFIPVNMIPYGQQFTALPLLGKVRFGIGSAVPTFEKKRAKLNLVFTFRYDISSGANKQVRITTCKRDTAD